MIIEKTFRTDLLNRNGILREFGYIQLIYKSNIYYNTILNNQLFGKNNPNLVPMKIGANWYGTNDKSQSFVCPMILGRILESSLFITPNGVGVHFYDGNKKVNDIGESEV